MVRVLPNENTLINFSVKNVTGSISVSDLKIRPNLTNAQIEAAAKKLFDTALEPAGEHSYFHLFSRDPLDFQVWKGPLDQEPFGEAGKPWWDRT